MADNRRARSGTREIDRLAIREYQLTVGLLSEPTHAAKPAVSSQMISNRHSIMKMATHSTSEFVIAPCFLRTSISTHAGHRTRHTIALHHRVQGSHTPPAPSALASVYP
jgi:hypothetical protein